MDHGLCGSDGFPRIRSVQIRLIRTIRGLFSGKVPINAGARRFTSTLPNEAAHQVLGW